MKNETILICFCLVFAAIIVAETGAILSENIYQHSRMLALGLDMVRRERARKVGEE